MIEHDRFVELLQLAIYEKTMLILLEHGKLSKADLDAAIDQATELIKVGKQPQLTHASGTKQT